MTFTLPKPFSYTPAQCTKPFLFDHPKPAQSKAGQWLKHQNQQKTFHPNAYLPSLDAALLAQSGAVLVPFKTNKTSFFLHIFHDMSALLWMPLNNALGCLPYVLQFAKKVLQNTLKLEWGGTPIGPILKRAPTSKIVTVNLPGLKSEASHQT